MMKNNQSKTNTLLHASITGSTIEDFTQNAIVLPVSKDKREDKPCLQSTIYNQNLPTSTGLASLSLQDQVVHSSSRDHPPVASAFFSPSLSKTDESLNKKLQPFVPSFNQSNSQTLHNPPNLSTPQGGNSYRRVVAKRPVYPAIPGLTTSSQTAHTQNEPLTNLPQQSGYMQQPLSVADYFKPELNAYTPQLQESNSNSPFLVPISNTSQEQLLTSRINNIDSTLVPTNSVNTVLSPINYFSNNQSTSMASSSAHLSPTDPSLYGDSANQYVSSDALMAQAGGYTPVVHHWFHKKEDNDGKCTWTPFSKLDSNALEDTFISADLTPEKVVSTDGGRYDVNILRRERTAVYWKSTSSEVRRCSWFYKNNSDGKYVPYDENLAQKLESEFKLASETKTWHKKIELPNGENLMFHGPDVLVLFPPASSPDAWGNTPGQPRPKVVKRGVEDFEIDDGEPTKVDHLLFMIHGIGPVCDLKFRKVEEVVDEFRKTSLQLVQAHYKTSYEKGNANRVEILPISWHDKLHSDDGSGVDKKLKAITLESIPKLREFSNDTILDVLFYTSPHYCQTIITSVANEMNRIYELYKQRNPEFIGSVSLGGHSLGSLILFDILCHQQPEAEKQQNVEEYPDAEEEDRLSPLPIKPNPKDRKMSRRISYMMSKIGTGQVQLIYPQLLFAPKHFFALGSPIGMFVTVRGLDNLGEQFLLPTCPAFFNIFHPYDPVAYRIESLVNPELANLKPVLIPHHKGRKRMHLELKETMAKVGADLKQKLVDSMKNTWNSFYQFSIFKSPENPPNLEEEVDKVFEQQLINQNQDAHEEIASESEVKTDLNLGLLNQGRRIDYVLQEAPLEFFNEYIFALTSHVCYWESEDTMLMILKEIYKSLNISTDSRMPQPTMTIERSTTPKSLQVVESATEVGMDPTMPMNINRHIGKPPTSGFVPKI